MGLMVLNSSLAARARFSTATATLSGYKDVYGLRYRRTWTSIAIAKYQAVWECMYASLLPEPHLPTHCGLLHDKHVCPRSMSLLMAVRFEVPEFRAFTAVAPERSLSV
jgi:hypothetical protein